MGTEPRLRTSSPGGELRLSRRGQRELMAAFTARKTAFRTTALGGSMRPFIRNRDVLTIEPLGNHRLRIGEIAAFIHPASGRVMIHRVIARADQRWRLQGDNNARDDGLVSRRHLLGVVRRIERNGRDLRLGLGPEARFIALLNRGGFLHRLKKLVKPFFFAKGLAFPEKGDI